MDHPVVQKVLEHAPTVTYGSASGAAILWGMHVSDIAVLVSSLSAVMGMVLQFYLALRRIEVVEERQERSDERQDHSDERQDRSDERAVTVAKAAHVSAVKADQAVAAAQKASDKVDTAPANVVVTVAPAPESK